MLILKKSLLWLIEAPLGTNLKEILNKKMAALDVVKIMDVAICIKHPPMAVRDILTALQEEMLEVEVEAHVVHLVAIDTTLILLVVDLMAITGPFVVVIVVCHMIHIIQVQKAPHLLSQSKGLGKIDKIGMLCKINLSRI